MSDKVQDYRAVAATLPARYKLWPLYGAGFESLGGDTGMIEVAMPTPGPDELLVRHDACGICFSDIKVIRAGQNHPRIFRDMRERPVVLGHEVSLTVVDVGENLRDQYHVGDRFIVQADIYIDGLSRAYGYEIQGGFSEYNIIDQRVLNGDGGNYLIPVETTTGYAESALNEPWACVEASYVVVYRTQWQEGGVVWLTGDGAGAALGAATDWRPRAVVVDATDADFAATVRAWAAGAGVDIIEDDGAMQFDDIVILGHDPDLIERAFARLAKGGIFNVVTATPVPRPVSLDIGRMHYDHLMTVGTISGDVSAAYTPVRTQLKAGGRAWILGAAGPMGQMHVQRALEMDGRPGLMVATNLHHDRMEATEEKLAGLVRSTGANLVYLSEQSFADRAAFEAELRSLTGGQGFDDIVIIAASTKAVEGAMPFAADNAVVNVFAGLPRGTQAVFDINDIIARGVRYTGTSGSSIDDLRHMLDLTESHALSTNGAVAAVAGLEGVPDGLRAVADGRFAGKVVIYPHIKQLPLTPLEDLADVYPTVYAKLKDGQTWTNEAEEELLRLALAEQD